MQKKQMKIAFRGGKGLKHNFSPHEAKGQCMTSQWQSREKAKKLWAFGKFQSRSKQPKNSIEIRVFSLKLGSQWLSQIFWFNSFLGSYKSSHLLLTKTILNILALLHLQYIYPLFHSKQMSYYLFSLEKQNHHSGFSLYTQDLAPLPELPLFFYNDGRHDLLFITWLFLMVKLSPLFPLPTIPYVGKFFSIIQSWCCFCFYHFSLSLFAGLLK